METFRPGDLVRVRSGRNDMEVAAVLSLGVVVCAWTDETGSFRQAPFAADELERPTAS